MSTLPTRTADANEREQVTRDDLRPKREPRRPLSSELFGGHCRYDVSTRSAKNNVPLK